MVYDQPAIRYSRYRQCPRERQRTLVVGLTTAANGANAQPMLQCNGQLSRPEESSGVRIISPATTPIADTARTPR